MTSRHRSDVLACVLAASCLLFTSALLTNEVSADHIMRIASPRDAILLGSVPAHLKHARQARSLLDDDLITPALDLMFGGSSGRCCKQLTLCDLATTLLQAVEANKAHDADAYRRREQEAQEGHNPPPPYYRGLLGRFRRAEHTVDKEEQTPNPVLYQITKSYLRRVKDVEDAQRREELRRARATIERERLASEGQEDDEEDGEGGDEKSDDATFVPDDRTPYEAVQRIPKHFRESSPGSTLPAT